MDTNQDFGSLLNNFSGSTKPPTGQDDTGLGSLLNSYTSPRPPQATRQVTDTPVGGGNVYEFVKSVTPAAQRVAQRLNVPVEAVIGQWGLETGWGKSVIPGTNNLGNIKGRGVAATDNMTGSRDEYRQYGSVDEFADDFTNLVGNGRYKAVPGSRDAQGYFQNLKAAGYAEDPDYVAKGGKAAAMAAEALKRVGVEAPAKGAQLPDLATTPKWSQIASGAKFKALSADEQKALKAKYFDEVIAPHAQASGADVTAERGNFLTQEPVNNDRTLGQVAGDTVVQLAEGVNNIFGAVPNLIAPESSAAQFFNDNAKHWREQQSDALQQRMASADKAISKAGKDGVWSQIAEASSQYFSDPGLAARFITTNLPSMIPGITAAKVAQAAALARGATAAKAAGTATTAAGGVNAVLNAGGARGEAFDDIKNTLIQQGYTPEQAEEMAIKDSRVVAAVGGAAGFLSGKIGLEKAIVGGGGAGGIKAGVGAAAKELAGEQVEEVAPKLTTNVQAGQYDNRPLGQDVGRTIVETGIGSGPGAVFAGGAEYFNKGQPEQQLTQTQDGRIEPTYTPHQTSQTADAIVAELAQQAGVPLETVLPTPPAAQQDEAITDQDVTDFAATRYQQLREKRDGSIQTVVGEAGQEDQEVPGVGLSPAETQELAGLEQANQDPSALRAMYGMVNEAAPAQETEAEREARLEREAIQGEQDFKADPVVEDSIPFDLPAQPVTETNAPVAETAIEPVPAATQEAQAFAATEDVAAQPVIAGTAAEPVQKPKTEREAKQQKALDRIAKGTAYFGSEGKAQEWVKANNLTDTHTVERDASGANKWNIVAKKEAKSAQATEAKQAETQRQEAPAEAVTPPVEAAKPVTPQVPTDGTKYVLPSVVTAQYVKPKTEKEAKAKKDAFAKWWEAMDASQQSQAFQAVGAIGTGVQTTKASELPNNGLTEKIKNLHATGWKPANQAQANAPGTRVNGDVERQAADRLEQLHAQMGNITNRNSREGNAKASVRSVIEELRKAKTVTSVAAVLDGAANGLDRNYSAFADVLRDVSDSLGGDLSKKPAKTNTSAEPVQKTGESEQVAPDLNEMFDEVVAEEVAKDEAKATGKESLQVQKPRTEREAKARKQQTRRVYNDDGSYYNAPVERTATQAAASAATNSAKALGNAIDGLGALFGGNGKLSSGLSFDEQTYAKAKPLFQAAVANLGDAGKDIKEAMRAVVRMVMDKFGAQAVQNMKPYVVRYVEEISTGATNVKVSATDLHTPEGKFKVASEIADFLIGDGSFKTIIEARKKISEIIGRPIEAATELAKQADEAIEVGVVLAGRMIVDSGRRRGLTPDRIYKQLVDLYNRQPNLAVRSSTSVRDQAYSTPVPLAYVASELAGVTANTKMIESAAGNGMLAIGAAYENATVNELNPKRAAMLEAMGFTPTTKNAATETLAPAKSQDAVVINPPFGATKDASGNTIIYEVKPNFGTREVDHAIVFKTLEAMKDDGRAVLIVGGVQSESDEARREDYRGKNKRTFYFNLYNDYNVVDHFSIDGDMYSKQGASYPVDVIVIEGRGKSERDLPAAALPHIIKSYDELKEKLNGNRSVGTKGDVGTAGTDRGQGQAGANDGAPVAGSTVGSGNRVGGEGGTGSNSTGVRGTERTGDGQPAGSRSGVGTGQSESQNAPQSGAVGTDQVSGDSGGKKPGRTTGNRENGSPELGGVSVVSGKRAESGLTDRRGEEQETETQVAYKPHSQAASVGTLVPKAMRDAIDNSIQKIEDEVGSIDEYVSGALALDPDTVRSNFSAEQIDALALSIRNAEAGRGFIIGDQTGIGKGRVVAAMIRYAIVNGKTPIFVTEKPNLYSDMIRDLDDIGMTDELALDTKQPRIFITNGSESIPYTLLRTVDGEPVETSLVLKSPKSGKALDQIMKEMADAESLWQYKVIFTTYSQLQTVKGKMTERMRFIKAFGSDNYMIFDESHNAGGAGDTQARTKEQREAEKAGDSLVTGRAAFVRQMVNSAFGTFFSSATYAKRPDVMDLYSSTNMKLAVDKISQLGEAIKNGGVPMQQVVANMLTSDGQYIRRERTFAGVSYDTKETKVDQQTAENMASAMRSILGFSRAKDQVIKSIQKEMDKQGEIVSGLGESTTVQGANFGSIMHNLIDQMLLSLKAQDSVSHAIARLKAGEKVVMTVSNTMGSFLQSYAEEMGLNTGDPVSLSFSDLYSRYLEKQRVITIKDSNGNKTKRRLTDKELGPDLTARFEAIRKQITESGFGSAPISPIDYLHAELRKAGYTTDEITGRTITLNYSSGTPLLASRQATIKQRVNAVRGFNNGDTDVLILNQAGSTGLSLHAASKFNDKRKRHMIIVQAEKNIDTHMQMLGRVHRTGQVIAPSYSQMMADIPAEMRPAAVLLKKMASLNANTTASRKSSVTAEGVVDFMNDYGGQVALEYLRDNNDVHTAIGGGSVVQMKDNTDEATEDDIRKLTGYIPILPIKKQEEIYKELIDRYNELVERENSMGTNKLEAKAVDLDAQTLSSVQITEDKGDASIFASPANMEQVDVKRMVKPYSSAEVKAMIADALGGKTPAQHANETKSALREKAVKFAKDEIDAMVQDGADQLEIQNRKLFLNFTHDRVASILDNFRIGDAVSLKDQNNMVLYGVITGLSTTGRTANPAAGSAWKMQIALVNGESKALNINFSQVGSKYNLARESVVDLFNADTQRSERVPVLNAFDMGSTAKREKRWVVTGNILAGFAKYPGQIVSYTKKDGTTSQGVMMNRQFDFEKEQKNQPVRIKSGADAVKFLQSAEGVTIGTPDGVLKIAHRYGKFIATVPSSKREGGTYYLDQELTSALEGDFYKRGSVMSATNYYADAVVKAVDYLINSREETIVAITHVDKAKEMFGPKPDKAAPTILKDIVRGGKSYTADTITVDGKERPTTNSNGQRIAETEQGLTNFWRWFGDSKVVDDQGKPMVVYHESGEDFDAFDASRLGENTGYGDAEVGFHFADNKADADFYASKAAERLGNDRGLVRAFYLSLQNPLLVGIDESDGNAGDKTQEFLDDKNAAEEYAYENDNDGIVYLYGTNVDSGYTAIAFNPTQIKSAIDNDGTFDPANPNITRDLQRSPSPAFSATPEPVRADTLAKLKGLEKKAEAGKLTEAEYRLGVQELIRKLTDRNDERNYRSVMAGRKRGADWIVAKMRTGVTQGTVSKEATDFAQWLLDQNPNVADDLGISVKTPKDSDTAGQYNPASKVFTLLVGRASDETAVHEILHHTERMMPAEVQDGVLREWQRAWDAAYKKGDAKLKAALDDMMASALGDKVAMERVGRAFNDGTLKYDDHYQLYSPSEFWAVTATRIVSGRYKASGSWVARAAQWFKEFVQRAKGALGLVSDAPILKALKGVMTGAGKMVSDQMLVQRDYSGWLQEKEMDKVQGERPIVMNDIVRRIQNNAIQFFGSQNISTFNWYDKSIATQYHKAMKDKHFGKVYALLLGMQNHVSMASIRAAELAPGVMPRVDSFGEAAKEIVSKRSKAAMDAASNAIFAGTRYGKTVMDGRVWTDDELRNKFSMDDTGVALYRQARAAIDASLDEVAAAEAYAMAQSYVPKALRAEVIDNPQQAEAALVGSLKGQIKTMEKAIKAASKMGADEQANELKAAKDGYVKALSSVEKIFVKAKNLKAAGYAPLMRFGKFYVAVQAIDPETGNFARDEDGKTITEFFERYDTQAEARKAEAVIRAEFEGRDDVSISIGTVNENKHELFTGVMVESLELFAEAIGAKHAADEFIRLTRSERSALKRKLERKGTPGFSTDLQRVMASFITSNARHASQQLYAGAVNRAIKYIPKEKGDVQKEAQKLRDFVVNPDDAGSGLSSLLFAWFLGGSPAAAAVNMTQPVMMTLPYLSQYGAASASTELAKAVPYAMGRKEIADAALRDGLKKASLAGVVDAQEIFHLYSMGSRQLAMGTKSQAALAMWGSMFAAIEGLNRRLTFIAAWNMAKERGEKSPYAFAVRAVNQTQGVYNKVNRPNLARTTAGRALFTFKQFSIMYGELAHRMWKSGPAGKKAVLLMMAVLMLAGGEEGLPFSKMVDDLIDTIGQLAGYDTNMKRWKRRHAYELLGKELGDLFLYGASTYLPLDFGGRLGLGSMLPGTELFKPSSGIGNMKSIGEIVGPTVGAGKQLGDASEAAAEGNYGQAAINMAPKAVRDLASAAGMVKRGYSVDTKGNKVTDTTATDAAVKAVGFNPTKVAQINRETGPIYQDKALAQKVEASIVSNWSRAVADGDNEAAQKQQKRLVDWNRDNPDTPIRITNDQIRSRARTMGTDKETRLLKSAPKEMRGRIGLDLAK